MTLWTAAQPWTTLRTAYWPTCPAWAPRRPQPPWACATRPCPRRLACALCPCTLRAPSPRIASCHRSRFAHAGPQRVLLFATQRMSLLLGSVCVTFLNALQPVIHGLPHEWNPHFSYSSHISNHQVKSSIFASAPQDSVPMEMSARRPPLAAKPDQAVHRQPVRVSKRKPAKYNDNESFTLGEHLWNQSHSTPLLSS